MFSDNGHVCCPDVFAAGGDGRGITWGLSHIVGYGNGFLVRFDCDLHRDIDRAVLKHGTVQADETFHFQPRTTLPQSMRERYMREAASAPQETANVRPTRAVDVNAQEDEGQVKSYAS